MFSFQQIEPQLGQKSVKALKVLHGFSSLEHFASLKGSSKEQILSGKAPQALTGQVLVEPRPRPKKNGGRAAANAGPSTVQEVLNHPRTI